MSVSLTDYVHAGADPVQLARVLGLICDDWQARVLRSASPRLLLNCCRQSGKSTISALLAVWTAVYEPGALVLAISPSQRQSSELFRKSLAFYRALGKPIASEGENLSSLTLENGSRIISLPGAEGTTIRGYSSVRLLLIDEAARTADETYFSARPMVAASAGRIVLMSTPAGRRGFFYEAVEHESGWEKYTVPATECPRLSAAILEEERAVLGEWTYSQEYQCQFISDESQIFLDEQIEAAFKAGGAPAITFEDFE